MSIHFFLPKRKYFNLQMIEAKIDQIDQHLSILGKNYLIWVNKNNKYIGDHVKGWPKYEFIDAVFETFFLMI